MTDDGADDGADDAEDHDEMTSAGEGASCTSSPSPSTRMAAETVGGRGLLMTRLWNLLNFAFCFRPIWVASVQVSKDFVRPTNLHHVSALCVRLDMRPA